MGKSFWPFLVRSQEDVEKVRTLMEAHNMRQDVGEALKSGYVVRYRGHYFWLLQNNGGERMTTFFIDAYVKLKANDMMLFWPFASPSDWFHVAPNDVFYEGHESILARLPDTAPTAAHPFTREDPPAKTRREEIRQDYGATTIDLDSGIRTRMDGPPASAKCHTCGIMTGQRCAGCQSAFACSKEHQREDWPLHRVNCARNKACYEAAQKAVASAKIKPFHLYTGLGLGPSGQVMEEFMAMKK